MLIVDDTGEYLPLGLSELLATNGATVEVVSPRPTVGEHVSGALEHGFLFPRLDAVGVTRTANAFVEQIEGDAAEVYSVWGGWRRPVTADSVVLSLLRTPLDGIYAEIEDAYPAVYLIGDALAPRRTIVSIYEGERTGREI